MNFKSENKTSIKEYVFTTLILVAFFIIGFYTLSGFSTDISAIYIVIGALIISPPMRYLLNKSYD